MIKKIRHFNYKSKWDGTLWGKYEIHLKSTGYIITVSIFLAVYSSEYE